MSEPQLRCLLCDLLLADGNARDQPTETCKQCGRKVLAGQSGDEVDLQPLNPPPRAKPRPLDLDLDLLPEAAVVSPATPAAPPTPATPPTTPPLEDDIPSVPVLNKATRVEADVPTVQPRGRTTSAPSNVPYAAKRVMEPPTARTGPTFPPPVAPPPPRPPGKTIPQFPAKRPTIPDPARVASATPRPKVLQAFAILGCMTFLAVIAVVVIISCIVIGLMKASKIGG